MIRMHCDICGAEATGGILHETLLPVGRTIIDGNEIIQYDTVHHVCTNCNAAIVKAICDQVESLRGTREDKKVEDESTEWADNDLGLLPARLCTILQYKGINTSDELLDKLDEGLDGSGIGSKLLKALEIYTGRYIKKVHGKIYAGDFIDEI